MHVHMFIYIHICICIYVSIHIYVYLFIYIYTYICVRIQLYVVSYFYACMYMYMYMYSHPGVDRAPAFSNIKRSFSKPIDRIWKMKPSRSGQKAEHIQESIFYLWGQKITVFFKN